MRVTELSFRVAAAGMLGALVALPYYLASILPNPPQITGLELHGSLWLGVMVRMSCILPGIHLLFKALGHVTNEELRQAVYCIAGACGLLFVLWLIS